MKKIRTLLMLIVFFIVGITPTSCLAYEPLRVAILPIFNSSYTYDQDTEQAITRSLQARFSMPLAKVIILYDVIPANEVEMALPRELKNPNKPGKIDASVLQKIGSILKADVVIGAQIMDFGAITFYNFDDELFQKTDLSIRVVGYDTRTNEFLDIHDNRRYDGHWSVMGEPNYLATEIMEYLTSKVPYTWKH